MSIVSDAAEKLQEKYSKLMRNISNIANMKLVAVQNATITCDQTLPPSLPNQLIVPSKRPTISGLRLASKDDNLRNINILPWLAFCKKRIEQTGYSPLPICDYKNVGAWHPSIRTNSIDPGNDAPPGGDEAIDLMNDLLSEGYSPAQAAGILGNIMVESDELRAHEEYGGGGGLGWIQWTGTRATSFVEWADRQGLKADSYEANLRYLLEEIEGKHGNHWASGYSLKEFLTITDAKTAANYFMKGYERPGVEHLDRRYDYAETFMKFSTKINTVPNHATCQCTYGGTLTIVDPGQTTLAADPNNVSEWFK